MIQTNISENSIRSPCTHQGRKSTNHPDEDTPCIICAGDIISKRLKDWCCPFTTHDKNSNFTQLRTHIHTENLTDEERRFIKLQQRKVMFYRTK